MPPICVEIDPEQDLTVFTVQGALAIEELKRNVLKFYGGNPTELVLWDFSRGTGERIRTDDYRRLAGTVQDFSRKRPVGKSAIVCSKELDIALANMYFAFARIEGVSVEYRVFTDMAEAKAWLGLRACL